MHVFYRLSLLLFAICYLLQIEQCLDGFSRIGAGGFLPVRYPKREGNSRAVPEDMELGPNSEHTTHLSGSGGSGGLCPKIHSQLAPVQEQQHWRHTSGTVGDLNVLILFLHNIP
ncbi:hypothetical protein ACN38_g7629 [Penicillium nordicum]|uniref:Secreted protein n=1 Tax=Penicillium nordicum TaxID=229535 RepID=A0A0M8P545_9EURO|nr:hypothetical protein ACN38_g7629 [Penicillium nordicum]